MPAGAGGAAIGRRIAAALGLLLELGAGEARACTPGPRAACQAPGPRPAASLRVDVSGLEPRQRLVWRWAGDGAALEGTPDPFAGESFSLCFYDGSALLFGAAVPAPGGWTALATGGFRYRARDGLPDGIEHVLVRPARGGGARITVRGRGTHLSGRLLGLPALPLPLPLRVQLQSAGGTCWEAAYPTALRNGPERFRARAAPATAVTTTSTTTTTLAGGASSCRSLTGPCAADDGCPAGYACVDGQCVGGGCAVRADCPLEGECVLGEGGGACVCRGCGPQSCPLGCRTAFIVSGCVCESVHDCPSEDDVCFLGLCS